MLRTVAHVVAHRYYVTTMHRGHSVHDARMHSTQGNALLLNGPVSVRARVRSDAHLVAVQHVKFHELRDQMVQLRIAGPRQWRRLLFRLCWRKLGPLPSV